MKAHGLLQRASRRYAYHLTDKGTRSALLFLLFHQRVCGPLANGLFQHRSTQSRAPISKIEAALSHSQPALFDRIIQLLAA